MAAAAGEASWADGPRRAYGRRARNAIARAKELPRRDTHLQAAG